MLKSLLLKERLQQSSLNTVHLFALFCVIFIPFPFYLFPFQLQITDFFFGGLIVTLSKQTFGITLKNPEISSDSTSMYVLILILFSFSIIASIILLFIKKWRKNTANIFTIFHYFFCYYLALLLLKYGVDKIFKSQFYLPEPNILYTPLGKISKDLLYWSSMGTSYGYTVFAGTIEATAAVFILFKRTRVLGLVLSAGIMLNVVAINFGFDISVKIYSLFLLFLSLFLLSPQFKRLYRFFVLQKSSIIKNPTAAFSIFNQPFFSVSIKCFLIGIIFTEALYPYLNTKNFNDDLVPRPYLHGAYEVIETVSEKKFVPLNLFPVKRVFIHRRGYIIFQNMKDEMQDFKLDIDIKSGSLQLTDYKLNRTELPYFYNQNDSILELHYFNQNKKYLLKAKSLDWKKLPALQNEFHWTVDGNFLPYRNE